MISVVIPVYKVEQYLDTCIRSVVQQTYKDLEMILVDDGSPDESGKKCDCWAQKDPRIKVIHQDNSGGAAARNKALDIAEGDLIAFVDSDDYIASDMFEYLVSLINKGADIAECDYVNVHSDNILFPEKEVHETVYSTEEAMRLHIADKAFKQIIWNKLYRKELLSGIRFTEGKRIDDEFFTYRVIANAKVLVHSTKVCYAYRNQNDSVMHSMGIDKRMQAIEAKEIRNSFIKEKFPILMSESLVNLWMTCIYLGQMILRDSQNPQKDELLGGIKSVLNRNPVMNSDLNTVSLKNRIWLILAKHSFIFACTLRNRLKIGL